MRIPRTNSTPLTLALNQGKKLKTCSFALCTSAHAAAPSLFDARSDAYETKRTLQAATTSPHTKFRAFVDVDYPPAVSNERRAAPRAGGVKRYAHTQIDVIAEHRASP